MQEDRTRDDDARPPHDAPKREALRVRALPGLDTLIDGFAFGRPKAANRIRENEGDVDDRRPHDRAESDDERDFAHGKAGLEPTDAHEVGLELPREETGDDRGHA